MTDDEKLDMYIEVVNLVEQYLGHTKAKAVYEKLFEGGMHAQKGPAPIKAGPEPLKLQSWHQPLIEHTHTGKPTHTTTDGTHPLINFEDLKQKIAESAQVPSHMLSGDALLLPWAEFQKTYPMFTWEMIENLSYTLGKPHTQTPDKPGNIVKWIKALREAAGQKTVTGPDGYVQNISVLGLKDAKFFVNWLEKYPDLLTKKTLYMFDKTQDSSKKFAEEYLQQPVPGGFVDAVLEPELMSWSEFSNLYPKAKWQDILDIKQLLGIPGSFNLGSWYQFIKDKLAGTCGYLVSHTAAKGLTAWLKKHKQVLESKEAPWGDLTWDTSPDTATMKYPMDFKFQLPKGKDAKVQFLPQTPTKLYWTNEALPQLKHEGMLAWWDFKAKYPVVTWAQILGMAKELGDPLGKKAVWVKRVRLLGVTKKYVNTKGHAKVGCQIALTDAQEFVRWLTENVHWLTAGAEPVKAETATPMTMTLTSGVLPVIGDILMMNGEQMIVVEVLVPNTVKVVPLKHKPSGVTLQEYAKHVVDHLLKQPPKGDDHFDALAKTATYAMLYGGMNTGKTAAMHAFKNKLEHIFDTEMKPSPTLYDFVKAEAEAKAQEDAEAAEPKIEAKPEPKVIPITDLLEQMKKTKD